jgi:LysM repeat protein
MKRLVLFLINLTFFYFTTAQPGTPEVVNLDGKSFKVYYVQAGDGWYSIARKFEVTYAELRLANKNSGDKLLIGGKILIPLVKLKSNDPFFNKNYLDNTEPPDTLAGNVYHTVEKAQTLYRIALIYNTSVEQLKSWNNLAGNEIAIGQRLIVGKGTGAKSQIKVEPDSLTRENASPNEKPVKKADYSDIIIAVPSEIDEIEASRCEEPIYIDRKYNQYPYNEPGDSSCLETKTESTPETELPEVNLTESDALISENADEKTVFNKGRKEINEEGFATWSEDESGNQEKYYAYHRSAPPGTIIKVTNFSNQKRIFVKVIGRLSEAPGDDEPIIRISRASAEKLGVADKKFQVRLQYGVDAE